MRLVENSTATNKFTNQPDKESGTVSVVMSVYNNESTLIASIESILNQTFTEFEFLIIDDGSADKSFGILSQYQANDSRVKIFKNSSNCGLAKSLNWLIKNHANGEYIARMDADDISLADRFYKQVEFLNSNREIGVVGSNYYLMGIDKSKDQLYTLPREHEEIFNTEDNNICHPSAMFRKGLFLKVGGFREEFPVTEDYDLWLRLSKITRFYNLPEPLLRYRVFSEGMTNSSRIRTRIYHEVALLSSRNGNLSIEKAYQLAKIEFNFFKRIKFLLSIYFHQSRLITKLGFRGFKMRLLSSLFKDLFRV